MRILISEKLSAHKYKMPEGYLVCVDSILARTGKQEYRRHELYGDSCDNPDEVIELERPENEVFDSKTLASFENKALCLDHPDEDVDSENHNQLSVGFIRDIKRGKDNGEDVMLGTLVITDQIAIDKVESGEYGELSCGYNCDIFDANGKYVQTNIRGNHVALCQHGRAGIARIVDSINDGTQLKMYKSGYCVVDAKYWRQYSKNAYAERHCDTENEARYVAGKCGVVDGREYVVVDCNTYKVVDAMDFSKKTKQGYDVLEMYRDGGRLHAIFKRANDYGVALGYDTTDGQWAQGMYDYTTLEKARKALMEEKPYARRIMDSVEDEKETYDGFNYMIKQYKSRPDQLKAIKAKIESGEGLLGEEKQKLLSKIDAYMNDSVNDEEQWYFKGSMGEYEPVEILPMSFSGKGAFDKVTIRFKKTGKELVTLWNKLTKHHPLDAKDATWYYETSKTLKPGMKVRLESSGPWSTVEKVERVKDWLYRITIKAVDGKIFTSDFHANTLWEVPKNYHDSLKIFTVKYEKNGEMFMHKVKAETMQDAIKQVKEQRK